MPTPATPPPARSGDAAPGPALVIARGNPSAEQIAAVVAALAATAAARSAGAASARPAVRSQWAARSRLLRAPLLRGPGGWRSSALPR
jgi:hypothetical protein